MFGVFPQTSEHFRVHVCYAFGGSQQPFPLRVFADGFQYLHYRRA